MSKKCRYRIHEIKLGVSDSKELIPRKIEKKLRINQDTIQFEDITIIKEAIDAREKNNIKLVYTIDFTLPFDMKENAKIKFSKAPDMSRPVVVPGTEKLTGRPVIVGFGPCGIFAALELAEKGYKPIIIERGSEMKKRVTDVDNFWNKMKLDSESNVLFGEGGAGTFSDGKLTSGIKDPRVRYVLETFTEAGADKDILYKQKPHIGTDVLRKVVVNIRNKIMRLGGTIMFDTRLDSIGIKNGKIESVKLYNRDRKNFEIKTEVLVLALGHSARDTLRMINEKGFSIEQKAFSIGVRMEHPQTLIDTAQYGKEKRLPPAVYKVSYKSSEGRGVYSFCMCPGGKVITASTSRDEVCVNGMSYRKRDSGIANSGILCDVRCSDFESSDVLAGVAFQEKYEKLAFINGGENFNPPSCSMKDFLEKTESADKVINSLPEFASKAIREAVPHFARKIKGYDNDNAVVTAVETRSSSPVRIIRGDDRQSNIKGVYPAGEGAGYAGGITSAACDGIKTAEEIIGKFSKPE